MSVYFSISDPSGKFLSVGDRLDASVQELKEMSEKTAGIFTLSFTKDHCFWSVILEGSNGRVTITDPNLYKKAQEFSAMVEGWAQGRG